MSGFGIAAVSHPLSACGEGGRHAVESRCIVPVIVKATIRVRYVNSHFHKIYMCDSTFMSRMPRVDILQVQFKVPATELGYLGTAHLPLLHKIFASN